MLNTGQFFEFCLDSVKSALEPDLLEGTATGLWLVRRMSGTDQSSELERESANRDSGGTVEVKYQVGRICPKRHHKFVSTTLHCDLDDIQELLLFRR